MIILDTDIIIEYLKNNRTIVEKIIAQPELSTTVFSLAELYYGALHSPRFLDHIKGLKEFLLKVTVITMDYRTCLYFGKIKNELRKKGNPIGDFDIAIAGIALQNHCTLWTNNMKHYENISGLQLENPLT